MRRTLFISFIGLALSACYSAYDYGAFGPYGPLDGPYGGPIEYYPNTIPYDEAVRQGIIKDDRPRSAARVAPRVTPPRSQSARPQVSTPLPQQAPAQQSTFLPDRVVYSQKDPKWGRDKLGKTNASVAKEGCVVTSVAMALGNLGFNTNPGDLNMRLTHTDNFTKRGWLIWNGVSEVTGGDAKAHYYDTVSDPLINTCMARGDYPLVQFYLPNGRSHWAMIVGRDGRGYHMRDPLRTSEAPLIFPRDSSAFRSLRCVGLSGGVAASAN